MQLSHRDGLPEDGGGQIGGFVTKYINCILVLENSSVGRNNLSPYRRFPRMTINVYLKYHTFLQ